MSNKIIMGYTMLIPVESFDVNNLQIKDSLCMTGPTAYDDEDVSWIKVIPPALLQNGQED